MEHWFEYWNTYPTCFPEKEFFKQVGKTMNGVPISEDQIENISQQIISKLDINSDDQIVDLCCGNGIITKRISKYCKSIIGIDYSEYLICIAKKYFDNQNISYVISSVLDPGIKIPFSNSKMTKFYMYEALQHFNEEMLTDLLENIVIKCSIKPSLFIGSIPDKKRIWSFFNTKERKEKYLRSVEERDDILGKWWTIGEIQKIAIEKGFNIELIEQDPKILTSHYRFDVLLY